MFGFTKRDKRTELEKEIDNLLAEMKTVDRKSKEYGTMADNLKLLYESKGTEKPKGASADTKWIVAANLLGIAAILWHEKADIITSKAVGFILRGRV